LSLAAAFGLEEADFAFGAADLRGFGGVFAVAMLVLPASFLAAWSAT
jgi:hypothetical protein